MKQATAAGSRRNRRRLGGALALLLLPVPPRLYASGAQGGFGWLRLRDVDAAAGGMEVWLSDRGVLEVRAVGPAAIPGGERREQRWHDTVDAATVATVAATLTAFHQATAGYGRSGLPGEPYLQIDQFPPDGERIWRGRFKADQRPGVDELETALRTLAAGLRQRTAGQDLAYDATWRPDRRP